jgi:hypothetical protein
MDDEYEKSRVKEATIESASLVSSLKLGSEECLLKDICNWWRRI